MFFNKNKKEVNDSTYQIAQNQEYKNNTIENNNIINQNPNGATQAISTTQPQVASAYTKESFNDVKKIFKGEEKIYTFYILIWAALIAIAIIAAGINYALNTSKSQSQGWGWYVLIILVFIVSVGFLTTNAIELRSWKNGKNTFLRNYQNGFQSGGIYFVEKYRKLTLSKMRVNWLFAFFLTYFVLFNLVVLILYLKSPLLIGHKPGTDPSTNSGIFNFYLEWDTKQSLNNAFGSTKTLLFIDLAIVIATVAIVVIVNIFSKNRIEKIKSLLGDNAMETVTKVYEIKKQENKSWLLAFIFIFLLVVVFPLTIVCILIYRKFIRVKK